MGRQTSALFSVTNSLTSSLTGFVAAERSAWRQDAIATARSITLSYISPLALNDSIHNMFGSEQSAVAIEVGHTHLSLRRFNDPAAIG